MSGYSTTIADADDRQLIDWSKNGNLSAYDEIVRRYQQNIAGCLYRFCASHADLEDLVQETFIRAFRKLDKWKADYPFINWLRRIGYNLGYDYLRKNRRNPLFIQKVAYEDAASDEATDPLENIEDGSVDPINLTDTKDLIAWLLKHLRPDEAMIISMLYVDQCSVSEIAERTGWGLSKVKVKAHRTRQKLKQLLEHHETGPIEFSAIA
jgi:RNA polymerase sigma-70 factor (ECF subfamily)